MAEFKNKNARVHIVTGQILNPNEKNSGYERFTEGTQKRISGNQPYFPQDQFVCCPITGRKIIKK